MGIVLVVYLAGCRGSPFGNASTAENSSKTAAQYIAELTAEICWSRRNRIQTRILIGRILAAASRMNMRTRKNRL